jgi:hypothetical protein
MSHPSSTPERSSSAVPSRLWGIRYLSAKRLLQGHHGTISAVRDRDSARAFAVKFTNIMVSPSLLFSFSILLYNNLFLKTTLRGAADNGGGVIDEDIDISDILESARNQLTDFATSDWLQLAPDLVVGIEGILDSLVHGQTIGDHLSEDEGSKLAPLPPQPPSSGVPSPALLSPTPLPLQSSIPSSATGSGPVSSDERASRPTHPLPGTRRSPRTTHSISPVGGSSTVAANPPPPPVPSSSAPVAPRTSSQASRKRARTAQSDSASLKKSKKKRTKKEKTACQWCASQKKGCAMVASASPPACKACIAKNQPCVPQPGALSSPFFFSLLIYLKVRTSSPRSRSRGQPSPAVVVVTPPIRKRSRANRARSPSDYILLADGNYPDPPPVPLSGLADGPAIHKIIAWRNDVIVATRDRDALQRREAALQQDLADLLEDIVASNRRLRSSWQSYFDSMGYRLVADGAPVDPEKFVLEGGHVSVERRDLEPGQERRAPVPVTIYDLPRRRQEGKGKGKGKGKGRGKAPDNPISVDDGSDDGQGKDTGKGKGKQRADPAPDHDVHRSTASSVSSSPDSDEGSDEGSDEEESEEEKSEEEEEEDEDEVEKAGQDSDPMDINNSE